MGKRLVLTGVTLLLLAGCGDPLRDVDRLSSVEVAESPEQVEIAAAAEKQPPEGGIFSGLFARRSKVKEAEAAVSETAEIATTPQTEADNATTDAVETEAAESVPTEAAPSNEPESATVRTAGLFGLFRRPSPPEPAVQPETKQDVAATTAPAISAEEGADLVRPETLGVAREVAPVEAKPAAKPKRRGLFGGLRAADGEDTAALAQPKEKAPRNTRRRSRIDPNAPDAAQTTLSNVQPFGSVARLCDAPTRALGKEVARYPERGRGYRLYDSKPGSTSPRSFYITGFKDGCARQFTAALAIFGSPGMHEQLRYGLPAKVQPYSDTDKAYETVKSKVCRVGRKKPCGAKLAKLESNTVFVSYYERFGSNARWANFLLHNGALEAKDIKSK